MAGSLNHIIREDGTFYMDLIENMGDAHEALEECFYIIADLLDGDMDRLKAVCNKLNFPNPYSGEYGESVPRAMKRLVRSKR